MKTILFFMTLISLTMSAYADFENFYCGSGIESYNVTDATYSLVVINENVKSAKIFMKGKDMTSSYTISKTRIGYKAISKDANSNNAGPSLLFKNCSDDNTTTANFIGGLVSNATFPCTCETM